MTSRLRRLGIWFLAVLFAVVLSAFVLSVLPSKTTYAEESVEHENHDGWTELTEATKTAFETSGGKYYLNSNLDITSAIRIGEATTTTATLCLNGHKLTYTGTVDNSVIIIGHLGTFTLCDYSAGKTNSYGYGSATGTETIATGLISGGKGYGTGSDRVGGGVYVDGGTFNMYGGAIAGNTATYGGGVYVKNFSDTQTGTFNMYGGTVTGNTATRGGVFVRRGAAFNLNGSSVITDNKTLDSTGLSNLYLVSGNKINVGGDIMGSSIGVTFGANYKGVFTSGYGANNTVSGTPATVADAGTPIFTYDSEATAGGTAKLIGEGTDSEYAIVFTVELMHKGPTDASYSSHKTYEDIIYGNNFIIESTDDPFKDDASEGACHTTMWFIREYVSGQPNENLRFVKDGDGNYTSPAITQNYTLYSFLRTAHQGAKLEERAATCTEDGCYECYRCDSCGNYFTDSAFENNYTEHDGNPIIPATGHNNMGTVYPKAATCEEYGFNVICYRCNNCDKVFSDNEAVHEMAWESVVIPKLEHSFSYHEEVIDCFEDGNMEYISCATGSEYYRMATDEDDTEDVVTIVIGDETYSCIRVGSGDTIPTALILTAKGEHTNEHIDALEYTCDTNGHEEYDHCTVCDKYFDGEDEITDDKDPVSGLPASLITLAQHELQSIERLEPNCIEDGHEAHAECTVCNKSFVSETDLTEVDSGTLVLEATGEHTLTLIEADEAGCEDDGNTAYYLCEVCGETFSDENGENVIEEGDYTIPAIGHKWDKMYIAASDLVAFGTIDTETTEVYLACSNPDCSYGTGAHIVAVTEITYISGECLHGTDEYVTVTGTVEDMDGEEFTLQAPVTVNKLTYDMSNITFLNGSAKANNKAHSLVISGNLPDGVTVTYEGNGQKAEGEYTVTAIFTGDYDNYNEIPNMTATLTIAPSAGLGSVFDTSSHLFYIVITAAVTVVVMLLLFLLISIIMSKRRKKKAMERDSEFRNGMSSDRRDNARMDRYGDYYDEEGYDYYNDGYGDRDRDRRSRDDYYDDRYDDRDRGRDVRRRDDDYYDDGYGDRDRDRRRRDNDYDDYDDYY